MRDFFTNFWSWMEWIWDGMLALLSYIRLSNLIDLASGFFAALRDSWIDETLLGGALNYIEDAVPPDIRVCMGRILYWFLDWFCFADVIDQCLGMLVVGWPSAWTIRLIIWLYHQIWGSN
ncbi:MAG: hypothetical protein AAF668_13945 [Pseudomonadota bacterium]